MKILARYADDNLLPVNINKTKAILVHNVVAPPYPKIKYKETTIEFVKRFKYLGVDITTKLGWESAIGNKAQKFTIVHPNTESKTYLWKSEKYSEELKKLFVGKKYNHALFVVVDKNEILVDFTKGNYRLQNQSQDEHYSGRKRP
ncbi:unnamed protein product [Rotaria magnacalcarata]|nr:unnamed protein product [Rotaria magnacalcarata]